MWWFKRKKRHNELKDYYAVLGIAPGASQRAVQLAFRGLAQTSHPDVNPDPAATDHFKELVEAYQALKHPDERNEYDARIISEFCESYLGSFDHKNDDKKPHEPVAFRVWRK